ncbi:FtsX-like permease family protein [Nocardioides sp. CN2-186]|uniref:FtsX-like permease family protein n=1 Tax=Nocardioides tweenelious TaxID=3156607 RepID=UPI0032B4CEBD
MRWRYRPFQAAAIAALAALITACAAFAPLYDRAMQQALTDIAIAHEAPSVVGLQLSAEQGEPEYAGGPAPTLPTPEDLLRRVPASTQDHYLGPIVGYSADVRPLPEGVQDPAGSITWRDGQCDHLTFVDGACPTGPGDIAVSKADAKIFGYDVGTTFRVAGDSRSATLTVTGVYEQEAGDYWFGLVLTGYSGVSDPVSGIRQHDVWLTPRETFDSRSLPLLPGLSSSVDLPLDSDNVGVDDVLALSDDLAVIEDQAKHDARTQAEVHVVTGLPDIAQDIRDQTEQSRVTVPLLMAQLGLLAVVVLWLVLLAVTEQRRPEVALARLRGRGRKGARGLLLGELLPVALVGVVPGFVAALLGAWFARTVMLPGDAPFEIRLPVAAAVLLAVVVLTLVTVVAVARIVREPVATLLRRVPPRQTRWGLGVADALVIAGCGALVVAFATGSLDGPIALAAPGLLAIVVGLVMAHLTAPTASIVGRRLLRRGRVRAGVSVLDAARSPGTRRIVAVVTLASALAVFSADAYVVGDRNRASAAEQEAGAPLVATVSGNNLSAMRDAIDEVDPDGQELTPVVSVRPSGDGPTTVAVVPDGFRSIALFPGGAPPASTWDPLAVPDVDPIELTGPELTLDVRDSTLKSTRIDGGPNPVSIGVDLVRNGETLHTTLGHLDRTGDFRLTKAVSCTDGCYVTGIWVGTLPGASIKGTALLSSGQIDLTPADQWVDVVDDDNGIFQADDQGADELSITVQSPGTTVFTLPHAWVPGIVPTLVPPGGDDATDLTVVGLDGQQRDAKAVGTLDPVPGSGPDSNVVNLDLIGRGSGVTSLADIEVWFAHDDPALLDELTTALDDRGIAVADVTTLGDVRATYDDTVAAWSLQLSGLVGAVSLLIALLVLLVSALSGWRFRTRDLAALRMSGVPGRSIRAMSVAGQLPAVLVGVVVGSICGVYGAQLALPIVPLFATAPEVSTLDLDTAWSAVVVAAVLALVVLGLGASLIGRALARRSEVRRLRETL